MWREWLARLKPGKASPTGELVDLFVMSGQSNMQGLMGDAAHYPADGQELDPAIRFYWVAPGDSDSGGAWTHLRAQPGRFPEGHFGPEITFARSVKRDGLNPAIFKYTQGTTSLAEDWKAPGSGGIYDAMVSELQRAIGQLAQAGCRVRIRAFVWIQGETDAKNFQNSNLYGKRLQVLLEDFRGRVAGNPSLPVLLGVDEDHPYVKGFPGVLTHQKRLAATLDNVVFTSMLGLEKADLSHLTPQGVQEHGLRLRVAWRDFSEKH